MTIEHWQTEWYWTTSHNFGWNAEKLVECAPSEIDAHLPKVRDIITVSRRDGSTSEQQVADVYCTPWHRDNRVFEVRAIINHNFGKPECTFPGCDRILHARGKTVCVNSMPL